MRRLALAAAFAAALHAAAVPAADSYEDGRKAYVDGDYATAFRILEPLARAGDAKAQVTLGIMYDAGHGVERDPAKAVEMYTRAAEQDFPLVQHDLGLRYYRGEGVQADPAAAARWWRKAAEAGVPESEFNLGLLYSRGLGVEKDEALALEWIRRSAEQGHAPAQYTLGVMYAFGRGVAADNAEAVRWFQRAAARGVPEAQFNLGVLLESGEGVERDMEGALHWYREAAAQGLEEAKTKLAALDPESAAAPDRTASGAAGGGTPVSPRQADAAPPPGAGERWVLAQDPEHYTLQLAASTDRDALARMLRTHDLEDDSTTIRVEGDGASRYIALHGRFDSSAAAQAAAGALPEAIKKSKPWPRKFGALQAIIAK